MPVSYTLAKRIIFYAGDDDGQKSSFTEVATHIDDDSCYPLLPGEVSGNSSPNADQIRAMSPTVVS